MIELEHYSKVLVAFSGGKDSLAMLLYLLELGVPKEKLELHHHLVDGAGESFFDWECTKAYTKAIADYLEIPIYYSWRDGGFKREMLRDGQHTGAVLFETPDGNLVKVGGNNGKPNTRLKFPQVSADLSVRWCSAYLKIGVMDALINNQPRFLREKTLVVTGERAEESAARAKYKEFEKHRTNTKKRIVHHWRPLLHWSTAQVWERIEKWRIVPHPAYWLSFGRCSCKFCIFLSDEDLALLNAIDPEGIKAIAEYERRFETTISRTKKTVSERADRTPREYSPFWAWVASSPEWTIPIVVPPDSTWRLPSGAYASLSGGSP